MDFAKLRIINRAENYFKFKEISKPILKKFFKSLLKVLFRSTFRSARLSSSGQQIFKINANSLNL